MIMRITAAQFEFLKRIPKNSFLSERSIRSADQRVVRSLFVRREPLIHIIRTSKGYRCWRTVTGDQLVGLYQSGVACFSRDYHKPVAPSVALRAVRRQFSRAA